MDGCLSVLSLDPLCQERWNRNMRRPEELCCRTPRRSHVLQGAPFSFSLPRLFSLTQTGKGDEITVLMQLSDEDGLFLVRSPPSNLSKPATAHDNSTLNRATVKVSLAALRPHMFSSPGSSRHPSFQSALPPPLNHPVRAL